MLLKMPLYLDLDVFHMRDHEDRGGPEAGNLQQQFKNSEKFAFIFQIRKQLDQQKQEQEQEQEEEQQELQERR